MKKLKILIQFDIVADPYDEQDLRERVQSRLQEDLDGDSLEFDIGDLEEEDGDEF